MSQLLPTLGAPYDEIRGRAAELAAVVEPIAATADESSVLDPRVRAALQASGLCQLVVPARFGGQFDAVDALAVTVVRETLAGCSSHLDSMFAMQGIGSFALGVAAAPELAARWLPAVAELQAIAGLALTEPEAGSDLKALTTSVTDHGDTLIVNGSKSFISNGGAADFYAVLGREGDGYSLVVVPADAHGVFQDPTPTIIAPHVLGEIEFRDVEVPADHRLGPPGRGFGLVLATLATFRVSVAGAALGVAAAALRAAADHARSRHQFGKPLLEIGAVAQHLGRSAVDLEMARSLTYRAAAAATADPRGSLGLSSMAKVGATEACAAIVDRAVQVMGRHGLVRGSVVERCYRTARPMRIYEGATEVLLDQIAAQLARTDDASPRGART